MMADTHSPEQVAFKLLLQVAKAENKKMVAEVGGSAGTEKPEREWILDTYKDCIKAVGGTKEAMADVAYQLLLEIVGAENMKIGGGPAAMIPGATTKTTQEWILKAYADCLTAVKGKRAPKKKA
jgi:hypothetical protein